MKGNPVIAAGADLAEARQRAEKLQQAFERENRLRDKIVKAVAAATGISEKAFVNETGPVIEERLTRWVKDTKNKAKKGYSDLEDELADTKELLESKIDALEEALLQNSRIKGAVERLLASANKALHEMEALQDMSSEDLLPDEGDDPKEEKKLSLLEEQLLVTHDGRNL